MRASGSTSLGVAQQRRPVADPDADVADAGARHQLRAHGAEGVGAGDGVLHRAQRPGRVAVVEQRQAVHVQVRRLDAAEVVGPRQLDAAREMLAGGGHVAALVVGVAEPALGARLVDNRAGVARRRQRRLVGAQAFVEPPERKVEVAAQVGDRGARGAQLGAGRRRFGAIERRQRIDVAFEHPQAGADAGLGAAASMSSRAASVAVSNRRSASAARPSSSSQSAAAQRKRLAHSLVAGRAARGRRAATARSSRVCAASCAAARR